MLGLSYAGGFDELAIYDRTLSRGGSAEDFLGLCGNSEVQLIGRPAAECQPRVDEITFSFARVGS